MTPCNHVHYIGLRHLCSPEMIVTVTWFPRAGKKDAVPPRIIEEQTCDAVPSRITEEQTCRCSANRAETRVHLMHGEGGDLLVSDGNIASQDLVHKT